MSESEFIVTSSPPKEQIVFESPKAESEQSEIRP